MAADHVIVLAANGEQQVRQQTPAETKAIERFRRTRFVYG